MELILFSFENGKYVHRVKKQARMENEKRESEIEKYTERE